MFARTLTFQHRSHSAHDMDVRSVQSGKCISIHCYDKIYENSDLISWSNRHC